MFRYILSFFKNEPEILQIKRLSQSARLPTKGSEDSAGFDLFATESVNIQPGDRMLIKTDIAIEKFPKNTYGRIASRSGLALKHIDVGAGVIDQDYRGSVTVILINNGNEFFEIEPGMRIAQLICEKCSYPEIEEVYELSTTTRGDSGFGSSGR